MFDFSWGELLVLVVAGLFILGPERLPSAAAWIGRTVRQVRGYASGARDQLRSEIGPEFDQLRKPLEELQSLRDLNPKRMVTRHLMDVQQDIKAIENDLRLPPTSMPSSRPAVSPPPQRHFQHAKLRLTGGKPAVAHIRQSVANWLLKPV